LWRQLILGSVEELLNEIAVIHGASLPPSMALATYRPSVDIKKARTEYSAGFLELWFLYGYDILSLRTFLALSYGELNFLAFNQCLEA